MNHKEAREQKKARRKQLMEERKADPRTMREKVYDEIAKYISVKAMDYIIWGLVGLLLLVIVIGMIL